MVIFTFVFIRVQGPTFESICNLLFLPHLSIFLLIDFLITKSFWNGHYLSKPRVCCNEGDRRRPFRESDIWVFYYGFRSVNNPRAILVQYRLLLKARKFSPGKHNPQFRNLLHHIFIINLWSMPRYLPKSNLTNLSLTIYLLVDCLINPRRWKIHNFYN